jgi:gliding motility-associated-like protein
VKNRSQILIVIACLLAIHSFAQQLEPFEFIENKGQWDEQVKFKAAIPGGSLFIHNNGYTVLQNSEEDLARVHEILHHRTTDSGFILRSHAYRVSFEGCSLNTEIVADKDLPGVYNYYSGNDPSKWGSNCKRYLGITVKNIYPGINLRYYTSNGSLKYDLIVNPGAKVSDVVMLYKGADALSVKNGMLKITTSVGIVTELDPYSYQYSENGKHIVKNAFRINGNSVSFDISDYDRSKALVIDPTMIFTSFSGAKADNFGFTATYGPDGSMYGGGIVYDDKFPVTPGAVQSHWGGGLFDMGIMRLSANGSTLMYGTFIGGNGEDQPHSLIADASGNLVIAGRTDSQNPTYPLLPAGSSIGTNGGYDIVVTMLNNTGGLLASKRIGGSGDDGVNISAARTRNSLQFNYGDDGRSEVMLDGGGNIYVASITRSNDFPFTANATQQVLKGSQDGVVLKFSPNLGTLLMATYLGGANNDAAYVLDVSRVTGNVYVAGGTESSDFPGTDASSVNQNAPGAIDGYISMFSPDLTTLIRTSFIGTASYDQVYGVKTDRFGYPYVMGQTLTNNWPRVNANFYQAAGKQFIMKLLPNLNGVVYSTVFGNGSSNVNISPTAFMVDRCENVYVSGWGGYLGGGFTSSGTTGLTITSDAYIPPNYSAARPTDGNDFYFFVLKKNAASQLYGSFFGQDGGTVDHVDGGTSRFNEDGTIYQAMCANCDNQQYFPTTSGAYATANGSPRCNLAMLKMAFNLSGLKSFLQSTINGEVRDTAGCVPLTVNFNDTVAKAVTYEWDFDGDGVTDRITQTPNTSWTYLVIRNYRVRLIAVDSSTCNIRDTTFITIRVGNIETHPDFSFARTGPCDSLQYLFTNTTFQPPIKQFRDSSFIWDFGDGSPLVRLDGRSVTHKFPATGSYRIRLLLRDTAYCNAPEFKDSLLNIAIKVKAAMDSIPGGCQPYNVSVKNNSTGGVQFFWDFGDPSSGINNYSTLSKPPNHIYTLPGTYTIKLRVTDSSTCNIVDSISYIFKVYVKPKAVIGSVSPQPSQVNTPFVFTNNSSIDASSFRWEFGDGDFINTLTRNAVSHQYNQSKTYTVLLIAKNANGCFDTASRQVQALTVPAVDVPNAFTPLNGGINNIVYVRGYAIAKMKFTIWNRWGQKLFETDDMKLGWDGTYKGVVQPMDAYAYTLDVEFFDESKLRKTGDITLIR